MRKCFALMIFLASFLLLVLQNLELVHAVGCAGSLFNVNSTYAQNRHNLFSTLASKVIANGRLYNDSLGQNPNRVHALVFCTRGDEKACWGNDDVDDQVSCLVRSSNHTTFQNLELRPAVIHPSPDSIEPSKNMTLFTKQWEATVNWTIKFWGRKGGAVSRPSCLFRWDLYRFHGAFDNVTIFFAPPRFQPPENDKKGKGIRLGGIIAIVVPAFITLLVFIGLVKLYARRRKCNNGIYVGSAEYSELDCQYMLRFDLGMILMATDDFSSENKLGQGGFGTVYKGILLNGREIAVKRLTRDSEEGYMEFKNEVALLTRLQHKNLVKLLGFCHERDEEILVYEFVPNSSLDHFIFDEEKRSLLTWEVRFKIIEGVARGLVYLHEDSQLKIIHRDLKPSNILLDAEMNPKVADFGTARLFDTDETRAETKRIAGTRGYMAPEYLNYGQISAKSDVYSFGVMLLEMISGKRNNSFEGEGIAAFAWKRWDEGRPEIIIDPFLIEKPRNEIIKLIQIGLLCVHENATKRPTMRSLIVWLSRETISIPLPKDLAFTRNESQSEDGTMSMSNVFTELSSR
ncbi:putative cysteine-rich receptor-like protein kinase 39 [Raphanus sativus]|nr:putative cysteine-rich receptor-like protein kinase 39 [Raphanus sativus]